MSRTEPSTIRRSARATAAALAIALVGVASPVLASPAPPAPVNTLGMTCPGPAVVGGEVVCTVTGGDPGIDILWEASYNPVFATAGVTLDATGTGTFRFTVPAAAAGEEITVELVEWLTSVTLPVADAPIPSSVPAGALEGQFVEGSGSTGLLASLAALTGLVGLAAARRRRTAADRSEA